MTYRSSLGVLYLTLLASTANAQTVNWTGAADVPPVVGVMETYETILRDLRNVDERSADEDIGDIRTRIQLNGLIANMKAFQPRVTEVSFSLR